MKHSLLFILYSILPLLFLTSKISAQELQTITPPANKTALALPHKPITSGNNSEIPNESLFMKRLIEAVMNSTETEPRYGTLEEARHIGGDYIFQKKINKP